MPRRPPSPESLLTEDYYTVREVAELLKVAPSTVRSWCSGNGQPDGEPTVESTRVQANKAGGCPDDSYSRAEYRILASSLASHLLSSYQGDSSRKVTVLAEALAALSTEDLRTSLTLATELRKTRREAARQLNLVPQPKSCSTPSIPGL